MDGRIANEQNKSATLGASLNWTPLDGVSLLYNYIGGAEGTDSGTVRTVHELNGSYALSPRYEVFDDADGFALGQGIQQKITSVTLSNNFNLGDGLDARLEVRNDKSNVESTYFKNKDGQNSENDTTTAVALLYSF